VRGRETDPAGGAGDERNFPVQVGARLRIPVKEGAPSRESHPAEAADDRRLEGGVGDPGKHLVRFHLQHPLTI